MHPYFAADPVTSTIAIVTIVTWFVLEFAQGLRHRRSGKRQDRGSYVVMVVCVFGAFAIALYSTAVTSFLIAGQPIPFIAGVALTWGGIVLRFAAFRALGRYFTFHVETRPDQPVIATGPYRVLRHPSYTALWAILIGFALMCGTWLGVAVAVVLPAIGFAVRIRVEERALTAELGAAYTEFASTRKRLIPYIW